MRPLPTVWLIAIARHHFPIFLDFGAGRKSSIVGVWAAPGGRETLPKGVSGAHRAAQTPKMADIQSLNIFRISYQATSAATLPIVLFAWVVAKSELRKQKKRQNPSCAPA